MSQREHERAAELHNLAAHAHAAAAVAHGKQDQSVADELSIASLWALIGSIASLDFIMQDTQFVIHKVKVEIYVKITILAGIMPYPGGRRFGALGGLVGCGCG